jgi:hypothetical protein
MKERFYIDSNGWEKNEINDIKEELSNLEEWINKVNKNNHLTAAALAMLLTTTAPAQDISKLPHYAKNHCKKYWFVTVCTWTRTRNDWENYDEDYYGRYNSNVN